MNNEPTIVELPEPTEQFQNDQQVTDYVEYAETEKEPVYTIDFIQETICSGELETLSISEYGACNEYLGSQAIISFGNIIIGMILGYLVIKGLFDTWR